MKNLTLTELTKSESININGGLLIANVGKLAKLIDKGLRVAGVYEFAEGVVEGFKEC